MMDKIRQLADKFAPFDGWSSQRDWYNISQFNDAYIKSTQKQKMHKTELITLSPPIGW